MTAETALLATSQEICRCHSEPLKGRITPRDMLEQLGRVGALLAGDPHLERSRNIMVQGDISGLSGLLARHFNVRPVASEANPRRYDLPFGQSTAEIDIIHRLYAGLGIAYVIQGSDTRAPVGGKGCEGFYLDFRSHTTGQIEFGLDRAVQGSVEGADGIAVIRRRDIGALAMVTASHGLRTRVLGSFPDPLQPDAMLTNMVVQPR